MFNYDQRWTLTHTHLFQDLCNAFNAGGIRYFILRNYEGLPECNTSKDVDIIIEPGSYRRAVVMLKEIYSRHGFNLIDVVRYDRVRCCFGFAPSRKLSIHIDLIENFLHRGFELFPFDYLYRRTIAYKEFRVLRPDVDAVMLLCYKLFAAKEISLKYQKHIASAFAFHEQEFVKSMHFVLGKSLGDEVVLRVRENNFSAVAEMTGKISWGSKVRSFLRAPMRTLWRAFGFLWRQFVKIAICPQRNRKFIAVLGPDGVGKSTFIELLEKEINFYYVSETKYKLYHHRPGFLTNLANIGEKIGAGKADRNFSCPHRGIPAGRISSLLRMTYYWLDYAFGVPLIVRRNVTQDVFTIFDRYIYDFLVDPLRTRINLPYWIRKIFVATVPQPRIVFILSADADVIYRRKQELEPNEIARQLAELRRLADSSPRFVLLDASQTPEQLTDQAINCILREFSARL